jgi:hypothetical protein
MCREVAVARVVQEGGSEEPEDTNTRTTGDAFMESQKVESTVSPQPEVTEGGVARVIESQTAKLPSDVWLWAAVASMIASLGFQATRNRRLATLSNFLGQWVPTLLIFGLYNKLVKVAGHDRRS